MGIDSGEVVVVGGGVIGLSVAWRLGQRGVTVTLLESGRCGQESSWACAGILAPGNPNFHGPMTDLHLEALNGFPDYVAELESATGIGLEYDRCGRIELCTTDQRYRMGLSEIKSLLQTAHARWSKPCWPC